METRIVIPMGLVITGVIAFFVGKHIQKRQLIGKIDKKSVLYIKDGTEYKVVNSNTK